MAWTLVKNEPGAGSAAALGSDWTEQAGVASWAKNGSGLIVPGESYQTAVRLTAEVASADMAVEAQINAAVAGDMDHHLIVRSDSGIADGDLFDSVRIIGSEVYYNGAYQDPLSYGNLPTFVANPVIRLEAQGSTYTFIFDGTTVGTLTARLDGTGGQYAGFKGGSADTWRDLNVYVWDEGGGDPVVGPYWGVLAG